MARYGRAAKHNWPTGRKPHLHRDELAEIRADRPAGGRADEAHASQRLAGWAVAREPIFTVKRTGWDSGQVLGVVTK